MMMQVELIVDYLSINFPEGTFSPSMLKKYIAPDNMVFNPVGKNGDESSFWTSPFGVQFRKNNGFNKGQTVYFSGNGMKHFESSAVALFHTYGTSIARIDMAFDINMSINEWRNFVKNVFSSAMDSERLNKKYNVISGTEKDACTVYIGSRRSPYFFRIYNKTLEQNEKAINDCYKIRFECEFKRFTRIVRGIKQIYDPTVYFLYYYSNDWSWINDYKNLLKSYFPECAIPLPLEEIEFIPRNNIKILLDSANIPKSKAISVESVYHEATDFNRTVNYIVDKFGKYIPFILMNNGMINECLYKAEKFTGFKYIFEGYVDVDDSIGLSPFELKDKEDVYKQMKIKETTYITGFQL